jgi:hypothetical protein
VPPEAPFFFSIAALSASVAGFAGLVAAFRRGAGLRPIDLYRLQEIVEFAFANSLTALSVVAVATGLGLPTAVRIAGVGIIAYLVGHSVGLFFRLRRFGLPRERPWLIVAVSIDVAAVVFALLCLATGSLPFLQGLLIVLLARPMIAFLFVLGSLETTES